MIDPPAEVFAAHHEPGSPVRTAAVSADNPPVVELVPISDAEAPPPPESIYAEMFENDAAGGESFGGAPAQTVGYPPEIAIRALTLYVAQHNRQAMTLAIFSMIAALAAWAFTLGFVYWMALVGATLSRSFNPETLLEVNRRDLLGRYFILWFGMGAVIWLGAGWFVRRWMRITKLREDRHYFLWVMAEFFMALPNVTLAIGGNFRALTRLNGDDARRAWGLMQRIEGNGGRWNVANLRQEIEDEHALGRIVFRLQLVGLMSVQELEDGWYVHLEHRDEFGAMLARAAAEPVGLSRPK